MASRKRLASVAHNLAHSFASLMNYRGDNYVLGHVLRAARETSCSELQFNLLTGVAGPQALLPPAVAASVNSYVEWFPQKVEWEGASIDLVKAATVTLSFDLGASRPNEQSPEVIESPFECEAVLIDDRGRRYSGCVRGWWYVEPADLNARTPKGRPMTLHFVQKASGLS